MIFELERSYFDTIIFPVIMLKCFAKVFLCSEVDCVSDKVVEDLISEAATIVALESD